MPGETPRSFDEVVLCHMDLVYRVAVRLSGDPHEAEDLVQETFMRAHTAFGGFEFRSYGAKPWVLKILHNVFFTRRGQANKAPVLLEESTLDDFAAQVEREPFPAFTGGEVGWESFDEEIKAAVESLPSQHRAALLLWALGDLSYKEIAMVLDCALGTVMSRLHRARQQLSRELSDYAKDRGIRRKSGDGE